MSRRLLDITAPNSRPRYGNRDILLGTPTSPIVKLKTLSSDDFEAFIEEWAYGYLKAKGIYSFVQHTPGSGDKGRDVIGWIEPPGPLAKWDNYQCKHYDHPLMPSDIWLELGKLCFYTFNKEYTVPERYYFVAPQGVGPDLGDYLNNPESLRKALKQEWDKKCKNKITKGKALPLEGQLLAYVEQFDFSIVRYKPPIEIIDEHRETVYHAPRFGGGLTKPRPATPPIPADIQVQEAEYIKQLLLAYSDYKKNPIQRPEDLQAFIDLYDHFNRQRRSFYEAEALRQFAKDSLPNNGNYEELKNDVFDGIIDTASSDFPHGYKRVVETIKVAFTLNLDGHALASELRLADRGGICHQLVNDGKVRWIKE